MRQSALFAAVPFAALVIAGCVTTGCAANSAEVAAPPVGPIVGGYQPANPGDLGLTTAEKMAVDEVYRREPQRSIVESVTREQQVVAGMNYRFTIKMSGINSYRVVVFKPLQGPMSISGFEKLSGN